jgi:hypothetical protein
LVFADGIVDSVRLGEVPGDHKKTAPAVASQARLGAASLCKAGGVRGGLQAFLA